MPRASLRKISNNDVDPRSIGERLNVNDSTTKMNNLVESSATGIAGLDNILCGGLTPNRLYLIEGVPGSGKTTLALQYLIEGAKCGEPVLYVTLSETEEELRAMARSHGWSLDGITIRELVPPEESLQPAEQYTMFHPAEVELSETTRTILSDMERLKPARLVPGKHRHVDDMEVPSAVPDDAAHADDLALVLHGHGVQGAGEAETRGLDGLGTEARFTPEHAVLVDARGLREDVVVGHTAALVSPRRDVNRPDRDLRERSKV